jgi:hypothetical protein
MTVVDELLPPVDLERGKQDENALNDLDNRLKEADLNISESWVSLNKRSMLIGWEGYFIKSHNGWARLGYADEQHYRSTKGIARSTWYKMVNLAEQLSFLNKEEFLAMSIENAEQLAAAPREAREDPALIAAASTLSARDFESELVANTAERENKPVNEVYVTIKWRIKQGQREVIERGLKDWQHEHGIDDPGYALELMIAEFHDRPSLVGFLRESIPMLTREVTQADSIEDLQELRKVVAAHIQDMGEILKLCCGETKADEQAA